MLSVETILTSLLATALVLAPGYWLAQQLWPKALAHLPAWLVAPGVGLALTPISWEVVSLLGLRWTGLSAIGLTALTALAALVLIVRARTRPTPAIPTEASTPSWVWGGLALVVAVSLITRFVAIRDLAYPPWVDSPQHALIVQLLAGHGRVPDSFAPVMPEVTTFSYHFGFHVNAVVFHWITGLNEATSLLAFGQILNALIPLSVYAFAVGLTRRPGLAVLAAMISGLISVFPGYYVTWGRYTQLTGLLILGPMLGLIASALQRDPRAGVDSRLGLRASLMLAVLISGLVFAHYRVLAFAVTFGLAGVLVSPRIDWRFWSVATVATLLVCGPWLWHLYGIWVAPRLADPASYLAPGDYNRFPWEYFNHPLEMAWWGVAAFGALAGLVRRDRGVWTTIVWAVLTTGLLNLPGAGTWVVNNNSWAISAVVPGSLTAAYGLAQGFEWVRQLWRPAPTARGSVLRQTTAAGLALVLGIMLMTGLIRGIGRQSAIINPVTVLALPADRAALSWMRTHLPQDAIVAVRSFYWLDGIYSATDGGVWIWPEVGLRTTTPPASYYFEPDWAAEINAWNGRWTAISDGGSPEAQSLLQEANVTHIYLGAREGGFTREMFQTCICFREVYHVDNVTIIAYLPSQVSAGAPQP